MWSSKAPAAARPAQLEPAPARAAPAVTRELGGEGDGDRRPPARRRPEPPEPPQRCESLQCEAWCLPVSSGGALAATALLRAGNIEPPWKAASEAASAAASLPALENACFEVQPCPGKMRAAGSVCWRPRAAAVPRPSWTPLPRRARPGLSQRHSPDREPLSLICRCFGDCLGVGGDKRDGLVTKNLEETPSFQCTISSSEGTPHNPTSPEGSRLPLATGKRGLLLAADETLLSRVLAGPGGTYHRSPASHEPPG